MSQSVNGCGLIEWGLISGSHWVQTGFGDDSIGTGFSLYCYSGRTTSFHFVPTGDHSIGTRCSFCCYSIRTTCLNLVPIGDHSTGIRCSFCCYSGRTTCFQLVLTIHGHLNGVILSYRSLTICRF
jgi:hypothetical protein